MQERGDDHAQAVAGLDVDVGVDASLADQPQARQALQKVGPDLGPLADQYQHLGIGQPFRQDVG